ncbi:hypothetical protein PBY51_024999 [Eleginops maclovinus]|uniref:Uncharacterized protein n=1 Tax=Eleginops maclovinus TaxID=56733 RepID=A0AAN8APK6_ELEMC|nr:hypothetical protein PBY51_024999 [Eleginops maclovinus]
MGPCSSPWPGAPPGATAAVSYLWSPQDPGPASRGTFGCPSLSSSSRSPMEDAFRHRGLLFLHSHWPLRCDDVTPAAPAALHGAAALRKHFQKQLSTARHGTDTQTPGII